VSFNLDQSAEAINIDAVPAEDPRRRRLSSLNAATQQTLESLNERGLGFAAQFLGQYVLATLAQWHPDVFAKYPNLRMPDADDLPDDAFPDNRAARYANKDKLG
jgi:hypothetical protein